MRKLISISLVFCLSLQIIGKLSVVTMFSLNKQVIVDLFCINKANEELKCEASCFMNEHVNKKDDKKAPITENQRSVDAAVFFIAKIEDIFALITEEDKFYPHIKFLKEKSFSGFVFHPPQKVYIHI